MYLQLALRLRGNAGLLGVRPFKHRVGSHVDALIKHLPFTLSEEQQLAMDRIMEDMTGGAVRHEQAFARRCRVRPRWQASLLQAWQFLIFGMRYGANGRARPSNMQSNAAPCSSRQNVVGRCRRMTTQEERARILDGLRSGSIDVLFGTHAVLGEDASLSF